MAHMIELNDPNWHINYPTPEPDSPFLLPEPRAAEPSEVLSAEPAALQQIEWSFAM